MTPTLESRVADVTNVGTNPGSDANSPVELGRPYTKQIPHTDPMALVERQGLIVGRGHARVQHASTRSEADLTGPETWRVVMLGVRTVKCIVEPGCS